MITPHQANLNASCPQKLWVTLIMCWLIVLLSFAGIAASSYAAESSSAGGADAFDEPERSVLAGYAHVTTWRITAKEMNAADWALKLRDQCGAMGAGCAIREQRVLESEGAANSVVNIRALYAASLLPRLQLQIEADAQINSLRHDALQEGMLDSLVRRRTAAIETLTLRNAAVMVSASDAARAAQLVAKTDLDVLDTLIAERSFAEKFTLVDINVESPDWVSTLAARTSKYGSIVGALAMGGLFGIGCTYAARRGGSGGRQSRAGVWRIHRQASRRPVPLALDPIPVAQPVRVLAASHEYVTGDSEEKRDAVAAREDSDSDLKSEFLTSPNVGGQVAMRQLSAGVNDRISHLSHHHTASLIATIMAASHLIETRSKNGPISEEDFNLLQLAAIRTNRLNRLVNNENQK